ncbi:MAG: phosphotransferase [Anaerolineae bacterium]|nr:phosphotransferase [Anaerolineae bacterium]
MKGERIGEGRTAEIFAWGDGQVLKLYYSGFPRQSPEDELARVQAVRAAGIHTPAALDVITLDDRYGVLFERVRGRMMWEVIQAQPLQLRTFIQLFATLHADLHQKVSRELPSRHNKLRQDIAAIAEMPEQIKTTLLAHLDKLPEGEAVCHGDFHPGNIMLTPEGPVIIDWVDGTQGPPLSDVARSSIIMRTVRPGDNLGERLLLAFIIALSRRIYLKQYRKLRPLTTTDLLAWELPVAAARLSEGLPPDETERLITFVRTHLKFP